MTRLGESHGTGRKRAGVGLFFPLALGITWALQAPAVLAKYGVLRGTVEGWMGLAALGTFGPLVAAIVAAWLENRRAGLRALLWPTRARRAGAYWFALALFAFGAIHVAGVAAFNALGGSGARWLYPPENVQQVAAMLIVPIAEEPGWRGFALPRLQARHGPVRATLLIGAVWAAWHTMMFALQGNTGLLFLAAAANILAGSFVLTWLYNRTGGSLAIAVVAHLGAHLNNPSHALPGNPTSFLVYTAAIGVAACALLLADRRAWDRRAAVA
jgi:membrane protease YdiL (CAAX protease family)